MSDMFNGSEGFDSMLVRRTIKMEAVDRVGGGGSGAEAVSIEEWEMAGNAGGAGAEHIAVAPIDIRMTGIPCVIVPNADGTYLLYSVGH